jgi:DNA-binding NtrC family response regulator
MRDVFDTISKAAPTKASILITGESGVGKELVADALHDLSPRKDSPLVKVHCAALAPSLLESELFGHEKGAFTGAVSQRKGRFELASGGTLFLDEIGEIDQNIQIKLLRVLQEKKFERVGGEHTVEADVRIVTATNKDLKAEIEKGNFREDLYFRLNVVNINVPPLRERKDDIPLLAAAFLKEFALENGKKIEGINEKARARLYNYDFPGNIRELRNCIESAVVMCQSNVIAVDDLPPAFRNAEDDGWINIRLGSNMEECEKIIIRDTLSHCKGNKSKAAETLEIGRKTLLRKLADYGLGGQEEGSG